jgi:hypothetical protein
VGRGFTAVPDDVSGPVVPVGHSAVPAFVQEAMAVLLEVANGSAARQTG